MYSQPLHHDEAQVNYNYHDLYAGDADGSNELKLLHAVRKHKPLPVKCQYRSSKH
jgi:hypothetical protein